MLWENIADNACAERSPYYQISPILRGTDGDEVCPGNDEEAQVPHQVGGCDEDASSSVHQVPRHVVLAAAKAWRG